MKLTFLGTGTSIGVPAIGCNCEVCRSTDARDKRLRSSAMIETEGGLRVLRDCGPDFRQQIIRYRSPYAAPSDDRVFFDKIDAVLLTRDTCDPLNRRAVRVSMGSVFLVPWTWIDSAKTLHDYGFKTAAMALSDNSISLDAPQLKAEPRLAVIMGTEGDGLPQQTITEADYTVKIPMAHGVDSLNVAAAAAVTFWELRPQMLMP